MPRGPTRDRGGINILSTKVRYYTIENALGIPASPHHRPLDWGTVVHKILEGVNPNTLYTTPAIWKQVRFTLKQQYGITLNTLGQIVKTPYPPLMDSSWIKGLDYDPMTKIATTIFRLHSYNFHAIPKRVFDRWYLGMASCMTDDASDLKRWWVGKTPSLGAFFNQQINGRYAYERVY